MKMKLNRTYKKLDQSGNSQCDKNNAQPETIAFGK